MHSIPDSSHDGFTLLETVVATGVLVTALAGIAQLFAASVRSTREAGVQSTALVAAQVKLERLRAFAFTYGPAGEPITDNALSSSPGLTLAENTPGFVDFLDHEGKAVEVGGDAPAAAFTRRWRIVLIDHFTPEALAIEVCVYRWPADGLTPSAADVCLATVRTRQP